MVVNLAHLWFISPLQLYSALVSTARADGGKGGRGPGVLLCLLPWVDQAKRESGRGLERNGHRQNTRTAQRKVGRDSGTGETQEASPLSMYHGGQAEKKYSFYVPLFARLHFFTAHSSSLQVCQGGYFRAPKGRSRESCFAGECFQTRRSHQLVKDKASGGRGNVSPASIFS
jgi:hypothetical protein